MKGHIMNANKENTFTEQNRFLVYSDQLNATQRKILDTAEEMISRFVIQTFEDEGETVTATDASYLAGLTVDGKAVQDGIPSTSSPVPIKTVESVNIWHESNRQVGVPYKNVGITWVKNADGTYTANGTATANAWVYAGTTQTIIDSAIPLDPGTYTATTNAARCALRKVSNGSVSTLSNGFESYTFTVEAGDSIFICPQVASGTTVSNKTYYVQIVPGANVVPYIPHDSIALVANDSVTPISLKGNVLASLPDGTKDVLRVDSAGHCVIEKRVSHIASYNGESVGNVYLSTTGELTTGAEIYYKASSTTTIDCGYITMPAIPDGAEISIRALVTPTIAAKWWTKNQSGVATAFSALSSDLAALQGAVSALDVRVTDLESANAKSLVLEKTEIAKELASEPEEVNEQEEMDFEE